MATSPIKRRSKVKTQTKVVTRHSTSQSHSDQTLPAVAVTRAATRRASAPKVSQETKLLVKSKPSARRPTRSAPSVKLVKRENIVRKEKVVVTFNSTKTAAEKVTSVTSILQPLEDYTTALRDGDKRFDVLISSHGAPRFGRRDVFTQLVRSIVWQQLSGYAARSIWSKLLNVLGVPESPEGGGALSTVLLPKQILKVDAATLRSAGLSKQKAEFILDGARRFGEGQLSEAALASMSDEDAKRELVQMRGVGDWTADMVLMFALERADVLPVGDLGIRKGAKLFFKLKSIPTAPVMQEVFDAYRPYRSYAAWYMWKLLDPNFQLPA